jgi:hypothetical protein
MQGFESPTGYCNSSRAGCYIGYIALAWFSCSPSLPAAFCSSVVNCRIKLAGLLPNIFAIY